MTNYMSTVKYALDSPPLGGLATIVFSLQHLLRVVPVIGILNEKKAFKPIPNPDEVEAVFDAPLEMFIKVFLLNSILDSRLYKFSLKFSLPYI